jgi:hypothetical protein
VDAVAMPFAGLSLAAAWAWLSAAVAPPLGARGAETN